MPQMRSLKMLLAILALVICSGTLQATATLVANPTTLSLSCDTAAGPTATTVGVTLYAAGAAVNVTPTVSPAGSVTMPAPALVNSTSVATSFSFTMKPGCAGATAGASTVTITFTPATGTALPVATTLNVTATNGSALAPTPSAVTLTCTKSGSTTYSASAAQTVNVYSAANGGTPFTVPAGSPNSLPTWLTVTPSTGGTAGAAPVALTVTATGTSAGCGVLTATTSYSVHLVNAPAPDKILTVTIQVGTAGTLSATPASVALTYVTGTTTYSSDAGSTSIAASPAVFFQVNLATIPSWLSVSPASGTTSSAVPLSFQPTGAVQALSVGSYSASVHLTVSGQVDTVIPVSLQVNNAGSALSIIQNPTQSINWVIGTTPLPALTITPISSDSPIAYSVTTGGNVCANATTNLNDNQGLAYNFGSPFTVTFSPATWAGFATGTSQTGTLTITPNGNGNPVVVNITVHVQPQSASITGISPAMLPTASSGTFTVALAGTGFVTGSGGTVVGIEPAGSSGILVVDPNVVASVQDSTSIVVTITVSSSDIYLPFSGNGGPVTLGVCNPLGGGTVCSTPTGSANLTIGINPIVSAITSASSYIESTPPALAVVAPYDILSIFGTNFCMSGGTGCVPASPNAVLYATTNATTFAYPTSLSPDPAGATQRNLAVTFYSHGSTTPIATAPLLFADNTQINAMAPSALAGKVGSQVDVIVSFGYGTAAATLLKSLPFSLNVAATNPGVFTVGGDGQGNAAALSASYVLISQSAPAVARATATDSDTILLYATGLGVPDSTFTGTAGSGGSGSSATCMTAAAYWAAVNTATSVAPALTSDDGLVIQPGFVPNGDMEPCFLIAGSNLPAVTVGGQPASVKWSGWVEDSVAGLYQINVQLPSATAANGFTYAPASPASTTMGAAATLLPVVVTTASNSRTSQPAGVNLWVQQGLLGTATGVGSPIGPPTSPVYTLTAAHGTALSNVAVVGTEGTGPYGYTVANGSTLPADLTLNSDGTITGTPGSDMEGTTTVVFTVTDAGGLTGNVGITFVIS